MIGHKVAAGLLDTGWPETYDNALYPKVILDKATSHGSTKATNFPRPSGQTAQPFACQADPGAILQPLQ